MTAQDSSPDALRRWHTLTNAISGRPMPSLSSAEGQNDESLLPLPDLPPESPAETLLPPPEDEPLWTPPDSSAMPQAATPVVRTLWKSPHPRRAVPSRFALVAGQEDDVLLPLDLDTIATPASPPPPGPAPRSIAERRATLSAAARARHASAPGPGLRRDRLAGLSLVDKDDEADRQPSDKGSEAVLQEPDVDSAPNTASGPSEAAPLPAEQTASPGIAVRVRAMLNRFFRNERADQHRHLLRVSMRQAMKAKGNSRADKHKAHGSYDAAVNQADKLWDELSSPEKNGRATASSTSPRAGAADPRTAPDVQAPPAARSGPAPFLAPAFPDRPEDSARTDASTLPDGNGPDLAPRTGYDEQDGIGSDARHEADVPDLSDSVSSLADSDAPPVPQGPGLVHRLKTALTNLFKGKSSYQHRNLLALSLKHLMTTAKKASFGTWATIVGNALKATSGENSTAPVPPVPDAIPGSEGDSSAWMRSELLSEVNRLLGDDDDLPPWLESETPSGPAATPPLDDDDEPPVWTRPETSSEDEES